MGRGWVPGDFPGNTADKRYLDTIFPDRPVFIRDRDGHQSLANSKALALAGVTRDTPNPDDGVVVKGPDGEPTGLLKAASQLVSQHLPPVTAEDTYAILMDEMQTAPRYGSPRCRTRAKAAHRQRARGRDARLAGETLKVRYRAAVPCVKGRDAGAVSPNGASSARTCRARWSRTGSSSA